MRRRSWESASGDLAAEAEEEAVSGAGAGLNAAVLLPMASAVAEGKEVELLLLITPLFEAGGGGGGGAAAV